MADGRPPSPWASLDRSRVFGSYATLALIVFVVVGSATGLTEHLDLGVLATLVGVYVTLLGLGRFVRATEKDA